MSLSPHMLLNASLGYGFCLLGDLGVPGNYGHHHRSFKQQHQFFCQTFRIPRSGPGRKPFHVFTDQADELLERNSIMPLPSKYIANPSNEILVVSTSGSAYSL